jgi:redox-sensitive bicupin YhaK (pirin superfamily)
MVFLSISPQLPWASSNVGLFWVFFFAASMPDPHNNFAGVPIDAITLRPAAARGYAEHGWLDSRHSFSFADYQDPAHMGFRTLRVLNDDRVAPGRGFGAHPHRDMEIFSYVLEGAIEHKDSLGNGRVLTPGRIQLMSAGCGVTHSEFNPSESASLHFLQIWILPRARGLAPRYTEWEPAPEHAFARKVLVISPDGREGSATINQDADVYRVRLQPGESVTHTLPSGHGIWLQIAHGALEFNGVALQSGDGASAETAGLLTLTATAACEALLFDLA